MKTLKNESIVYGMTKAQAFDKLNKTRRKAIIILSAVLLFIAAALVSGVIFLLLEKIN